MPASPDYSENLAAEVRRVYEEAELRLTALIGRYLGQGLDAPTWAEDKLLQLQLLQGQANAILEHVSEDAVKRMTENMLKAANRGRALGSRDVELVAAAARGNPIGLTGRPAIDRLLSELIQIVVPAHEQVLRWVRDTYRTVIARTSAQVLTGAVTRREAAALAFEEFAGRGVAGFIDQAGRNWALESYIEMATRTALGKATTTAYSEQLQTGGHDLVVVSDAPQECKICRPWEGKVLSLSGATRVDGVNPAGTLADAIADGLFHPNCRHSISLYQHGITAIPSRTADPDGDKARQRLRLLERRVRAERRKQLADFDAAEAFAVEGKLPPANARVRELQRQIREHVAATSAKRQPQRERLGTL